MMTKSINEMQILIVDDERAALETFELVLESGGFKKIILCENPTDVMSILKKDTISLILLDLSMPRLSGAELLKSIVEDFPHIPVIVITGMNDIESAVECMRTGAFDYMVKPVENSRLITSVTRALEVQGLRRDYAELKTKLLTRELENPQVFTSIVTRNEKILSIFHYIETIAQTSHPVLVTGETGVGKELVVQTIHILSGRRGRLVAVNAAGLDDTTFSDTLFGHEKGAFTGAVSQRKGLVESAAGGALFLDEIGDMGRASQVKLLRLLQEREYLPIGSDISHSTDARIYAATNRDIDALRDADSFRNDLYYRLCIHHVHIPPLRERLEDIPLLVDHFLDEAAQELGIHKPTAPDQLFTLLSNYSFPGNVRELRTMVFEAVSAHKGGVLSMDMFRDRISAGNGIESEAPLRSNESNPFSSIDFLPSVQQATQQLIDEALKRTKNNQSQAAELIGLTQSALSKRLKRMNLS